MKNYLLLFILFVLLGCNSSAHYTDKSSFDMEVIDKNKQTLVLSSIIWTKKGSYYYNNQLLNVIDLKKLNSKQIKSMEVIHDTLHITTY
ncbi:hypothetical protein [Flammeovirga sp. SJP92]|uniref:hypothetical protein n=1 Tax=Flammeovirga sp. SJP92 TaxID=1775430 RepID=UPI0007898B08|nr:hypothetical protein [Flammeovirga sp. SJP92]KXX66536.1 hypothetical protein AVL50_31925 [Flammeovirga sp. SJP92]